MTVTRKHYEAIARTLARKDFDGAELTADIVAEVLELTFPNFDRDKFFSRIAALTAGRVRPSGLDHSPSNPLC